MKNPFENISQKNVQKLLKSLDTDIIFFKENTIITKTIFDSKSICIVIEGHLQIIKNNYTGNNVIIEELNDNDIISFSSLYVESNEFDIISKEDSKIILIDERRLINFNDNSKAYYNQFIKNLFLILNEKMKERNERIQVITKKTIRDKLLEYFYIYRKKSGSINIYLPYNFTAFADYLGINRSALMRELKNLKDEGFIETKGNRIKLLY